jgi:hypothetical protein
VFPYAVFDKGFLFAAEIIKFDMARRGVGGSFEVIY